MKEVKDMFLRSISDVSHKFGEKAIAMWLELKKEEPKKRGDLLVGLALQLHKDGELAHLARLILSGVMHSLDDLDMVEEAIRLEAESYTSGAMKMLKEVFNDEE